MRSKTAKYYDGASPAAADEMARVISEGGVVLAPADTVYGLFGNALSVESVSRVYDIKHRERSKPFVIYTNKELVEHWAVLTPAARALIDAFWPRALSVIVPRAPELPLAFTGGRENVAVMTAGNDLISRATAANPDLPLFGTSVNLSGEPALVTAAEVAQFADQVDLFIADDDVPLWGRPSTIVDCSQSGPPRIVRRSAISIDDVRAVLPEVLDAE